MPSSVPLPDISVAEHSAVFDRSRNHELLIFADDEEGSRDSIGQTDDNFQEETSPVLAVEVLETRFLGHVDAVRV